MGLLRAGMFHPTHAPPALRPPVAAPPKTPKSRPRKLRAQPHSCIPLHAPTTVLIRCSLCRSTAEKINAGLIIVMVQVGGWVGGGGGRGGEGGGAPAPNTPPHPPTPPHPARAGGGAGPPPHAPPPTPPPPPHPPQCSRGARCRWWPSTARPCRSWLWSCPSCPLLGWAGSWRVSAAPRALSSRCCHAFCGPSCGCCFTCCSWGQVGGVPCPPAPPLRAVWRTASKPSPDPCRLLLPACRQVPGPPDVHPAWRGAHAGGPHVRGFRCVVLLTR